jgi:DNA polymerase III subunit gamma/tau
MKNFSLALAQKYRPLIFKDVLDQEAIVTVLKNILKNKKYNVPFMFTGFYGCGKTTLARIFARAILCENLTEDYEPCNNCESCKSFLNDSNLAYNEIDAATNSGVDKIRQIREEANFKSLGNSHLRVVVIDESHSISQQGNEALLKQLEENSGSQIYIFCTTSPDKMLKTVRSRCFEFNVNKTSSLAIKNRLEEISKKEGIRYEEGVLDIIAEETYPHVRDSLKKLDFLSNYGYISKDLIFSHFKYNDKNIYLKIILNLKSNLKESLYLLKDMNEERSVSDIYEGLIETLLDCQKIKIGIDNFKTKEQKFLASKVIEIYQDKINLIIESLINKNKYSDFLVIQSDIIALAYKLENEILLNDFKYEGEDYKELEKKLNFEKENLKNIEVIEEKLATDAVEKNEVNFKENIEQEENDIEDYDETSRVLKRYKSYPQSLALLMDKGKKSTSIKNRSTVELNKRVKDFKRNLDKEEISNFLKNKKVVT